MIDVNATLGRSPFRRLPLGGAALARKLKSLGVTEAWVGSFDALLHEDVAGVNARLADDCRGAEIPLRPFGVVNPLLPDWREDVRRCGDVHAMRGIRLHPEFHGYAPTEPAFRELLGLAAGRGLIVQIGWRFEDERTLHPALRLRTWSGADAGALADAIRETPGLRCVLLNVQTDLRGEPLARLAKAGNVSFDVARQEGAAGVARLVEAVGVEKTLFGTHAPFFIPESAALKLKESGLDEAALNAIRRDNAARLLG